MVVDLCKGGSLYNYLQKRSAKPKDEEEEEKQQSDDFLGIGGLMTALAGGDEDLSDIEQGPVYGIEEEDVKKVILQILSCVNYLHKNLLVHAGKFCSPFFRRVMQWFICRS